MSPTRALPRHLKRRALSLLAGCACGLFVLAAAHWGHQSYVRSQHGGILQTTAESVAARSSVALDAALGQLVELMLQGRTDCAPDTLRTFRRTTFLSSAVVDIGRIEGGRLCSGFQEMAPRSWARAPVQGESATLDNGVILRKVRSGDWRGFSVSVPTLDGGELVAFLDKSPLLFEALPQELGDRVTLAIDLIDDPAAWDPSSMRDHVAGEHAHNQHPTLQVFHAHSDRYPISAFVTVDAATFAAWHDAPPFAAGVIVVAFAALCALLTSAALQRAPSAIDEFDDALADGEILPHFQAIISLESREIVGCEMLARWIKATGDRVSPGLFIPLAEVSGRADRLTEALVAQAGREVGPLLRRRNGLKLSINVTPGQLLSEGFVDRFVALADAAALPRRQLVLELTERQELADLDAAKTVSERFQELGVSVAVDDAGAGHNGLATVQAIGARILKIDKVFVDGVDVDARSRQLIEMLVDLARRFDMTVVAEGVEREAQAQALTALGVDQAQGYFFARPEDGSAFVARIEGPSSQPEEQSAPRAVKGFQVAASS